MNLPSQSCVGGRETSGGREMSGVQEATEKPQQPTHPIARLRRTARQALDRLSQLSYPTAKATYQQRLARADRRFKGRPPLLIYTMGKVGSASMLHSLRLLNLERQLLHLHSLAWEPLGKLEESLRPTFPDNQVSLRHIWRCQHVIKSLVEPSNDTIQAISLIRDPLARNLSNFFQHIQVKPYAALQDGTSSVQQWELVSSFYDFEVVVSEQDTSALIELYFDREWHDFPSLWIDRELGGILEIDVYASPFPRKKGYAIYHSTKADLLLIRLRDLNRCAPQAVKDFLGIDPFTLVSTNVAETKAYVDVYRAFKSQIVFPNSYLDRMYDSAFVRHFYSDAECQAIRNQWARG